MISEGSRADGSARARAHLGRDGARLNREAERDPGVSPLGGAPVNPPSTRVRPSARPRKGRAAAADRYSPPGRPRRAARLASNPEKPTPGERYSDDGPSTDSTHVHSGLRQPARRSSAVIGHSVWPSSSHRQC